MESEKEKDQIVQAVINQEMARAVAEGQITATTSPEDGSKILIKRLKARASRYKEKKHAEAIQQAAKASIKKKEEVTKMQHKTFEQLCREARAKGMTKAEAIKTVTESHPEEYQNYLNRTQQNKNEKIF